MQNHPDRDGKNGGADAGRKTTPVTRILGIDPGTRHAGYGVVAVEGTRLRRVAGGCVHAAGNDMAQRLAGVFRGLREVVRTHAPTAAAIETVFAGENIRTAIAIGEARGVAIVAVAEAGIPVTGYEPASVKRAVTGSGRASKEQIREMIRILLDLDTPPDTDHEADALALAVTHALRCRVRDAMGAAGAARAANLAARLKTPRALPDHVLRQLPPGLRPPGRRPCR